jgi:hypothetical protein
MKPDCQTESRNGAGRGMLLASGLAAILAST